MYNIIIILLCLPIFVIVNNVFNIIKSIFSLFFQITDKQTKLLLHRLSIFYTILTQHSLPSRIIMLLLY